MEEDEALENDQILQNLRQTKRKKVLKWFQNLSLCLLKPDLLISQAFCIFLYGSFGAITPYLPLYLKRYNLAAYQVGIILGLSPIVQCIVSPVWMAIAGKWNAQKLVFLAGVLSMLVKLLLFLAVQPHKQNCLQSYVNSTTNLTYTRSMVYTDSMKEVDVKWTVVKPISKKKSLKTTASPARDVSNDVDVMDEEKLPKSFTTRHLMSAASPAMLRSVSPSTVVIKKVSLWDSNLNATVHYTITGDEDEVYDIFLIFLLFTLVCDFLQAPTFGLGDGSVFNRLEDSFRSSPTKMHLTGSLGWAGTALIVGAIVYGSKALHCGVYNFTYYTAFYFSIGFVCMAFTNALWFEYVHDTYKDDSGCDTWKKSFKTFCKPKHLVFLLGLVYISLCTGFLVPFLNWYIDDLGGSSLVVATVCSTRVLIIFMFYQVGKSMVPILGKVNVTLFALMCYIVCFFCYWLIQNTWAVVAIVVIEGVSFAFVWRCCDHFVSHLNVSENVASLTKDLLLAVFWGAGQGLGSIIGGSLYDWQGKNTFLVLGVATVILLLIIAAILCYAQPNSEEDEEFEDDDDDYQNKTSNYGRYDDYTDFNDDGGDDNHKGKVDESSKQSEEKEDDDDFKNKTSDYGRYDGYMDFDDFGGYDERRAEAVNEISPQGAGKKKNDQNTNEQQD